MKRDLSESAKAVADCSLSALMVRVAREIEELGDCVAGPAGSGLWTDDRNVQRTILIVRLRSLAKDLAGFTGKAVALQSEVANGKAVARYEVTAAGHELLARQFDLMGIENLDASADADGEDPVGASLRSRTPTDDERAGMDWWNGLSEPERASRLSPLVDSAAKAWSQHKAYDR